MNNYILIKITGHINRFLRKMMSHEIEFLDLNYINEENVFVKIHLDDYKRIKRLCYFSDILIIKYEGINGFKRHFKENVQIYLIVFLSFILMDVLTSFIVKIDIIHENSQVRKLVKNELDELGIKKYRLALDFDKLEEIKNTVLNNNKNTLEWLSITRDGMTYVIRVEERIITKIESDDRACHVISLKDALITKVIAASGSVVVRSGDYVKKGDILISGELKLYDEIKGNVHAKGEVYGDVWYTVDISIPLKETIRKKTDKKRFNMIINNKSLLKNKYQYFEQTKIKKISIFGFKVTFYTEEEYTLTNIIYNSKEAEAKALEKIEGEFKIKLAGRGSIKEKKVLKKEQNNSTMNISVFVVVNEIISSTEYYEIGSDLLDSESSD